MLLVKVTPQLGESTSTAATMNKPCEGRRVRHDGHHVFRQYLLEEDRGNAQKQNWSEQPAAERAADRAK